MREYVGNLAGDPGAVFATPRGRSTGVCMQGLQTEVFSREMLMGGDLLLTPRSLEWCRDAAGSGPRHSAGWDQPCTPAAARRSRCDPLDRLRAGLRAPPVPGRGQPVGAEDGAGRRCGPGERPGTAGWSAPACTPATTALGGGRNGADSLGFAPGIELGATPVLCALRINHTVLLLLPFFF